ncbi:MAG: outer membrane beta-barrel protein [Rhizobacter sp.]
MKKTLLALAATFACTLASHTALAQSYYVGIAAGVTNQDVNCSGWSNCDKSDTGFKLYGGFKLSKAIALELGYTDFGSASLSLGGLRGSYSASALSAGGAFFLPLTPKLTGIGRAGLAYVDGDYSGGVFGVNGGSESGIEPYIGFGLAYALTPKLSLTGSFDYMRADYPRGSGSARLLGLGLSYAF